MTCHHQPACQDVTDGIIPQLGNSGLSSCQGSHAVCMRTQALQSSAYRTLGHDQVVTVLQKWPAAQFTDCRDEGMKGLMFQGQFPCLPLLCCE